MNEKGLLEGAPPAIYGLGSIICMGHIALRTPNDPAAYKDFVEAMLGMAKTALSAAGYAELAEAIVAA